MLENDAIKYFIVSSILKRVTIALCTTSSIYAGRELEFRLPGARRPIKERIFILTTKVSLRTKSVAKCAGDLVNGQAGTEEE